MNDRRASGDGRGTSVVIPRWYHIAIAAALAVAVIFTIWRFWYTPRQVESLYAEGSELYAAGEIQAALDPLRRAHRMNPDDIGANILLGWSHWRLGQLPQAEQFFERAYTLDSNRLEAIQGLSRVRLAMGQSEEVIPLLERAAEALPLDVSLHMTLANAYRQSGQNLAAAGLYRELLWRDPENFEAEQALLEMFGYPRLGLDASFTLPDRPRPDSLVLGFRTQEDRIEVAEAGQWNDAYLAGVALSPAGPGEFSVNAALDYQTYAEWIRQMGEMNANTVRVYTIFPPAFYQALRAYNLEAERPLWLVQGVWLDDLAESLWDEEVTDAFSQAVRNTIDVIHGRANLACLPGHYCGVYAADVSEWVIGLGVGRDLEPSLVRRTDQENPDRTSYAGTYVSLPQGSPTEAWFARMMDLAAQYETDTYNAQRPLALVNWPGLDVLEHGVVAPLEDQLAFRRAAGEQVLDTLPTFSNDIDGASIDVTRFETREDFEAGIFALYHVFQHRPVFMFEQPEYLGVSDAQGSNPYLGYLLDLKEAHPDVPIVVGAYGASSAKDPADLHPLGWHNGGLSEEEQADLVVRFSGNIRDAGMAGGIVFEWLDEWWKQVNDDFVTPLEAGRSRDPFWLNELDPEELFGLVGFEPYRDVPLLRGRPADWEGAEALYVRQADPVSGQSGQDDRLQAVYAAADYSHLYLRVDLQPAPAGQWASRSLLIGLNTLPGQGGSPILEPGLPRVPSGANFLVRLDGLADGELLVADNYAPWELRDVTGRPGVQRVQTRADLSLSFDSAGFRRLVVEANPPVWTRDGEEIPAQIYERGALRFGTADPAAPGYESRASWNVDPGSGMVELRIPWADLLVMDPSRKTVFTGTDGDRLLPGPSEGVSVAVLALDRQGSAVSLEGSFPALGVPTAGGREQLAEPVAVFTWEDWTEVRYRSYLKPAYFALQDVWGSWFP